MIYPKQILLKTCHYDIEYHFIFILLLGLILLCCMLSLKGLFNFFLELGIVNESENKSRKAISYTAR